MSLDCAPVRRRCRQRLGYLATGAYRLPRSSHPRKSHRAGSPAKRSQKSHAMQLYVVLPVLFQRFVLGVESVKMRWRMIPPKHLNYDSIENADRRHWVPPGVLREYYVEGRFANLVKHLPLRSILSIL